MPMSSCIVFLLLLALLNHVLFEEWAYKFCCVSFILFLSHLHLFALKDTHTRTLARTHTRKHMRMPVIYYNNKCRNFTFASTGGFSRNQFSSLPYPRFTYCLSSIRKPKKEIIYTTKTKFKQQNKKIGGVSVYDYQITLQFENIVMSAVYTRF